MTERERQIAFLQAQIQCIQEVNEDHIGQQVWVRDGLKDPWQGPFVLEDFGTGDEGFPYGLLSKYDEYNTWRFATLQPPALNLVDIELIPWKGGECPVEEGQAVLIQEGSGNMRVMYQHNMFSDAWKHSIDEGKPFWIVAYLPVNVTVKGEGDAKD